MDAQELQRTANDVATGLPGVTFEHRENPNWETYKVGGKVFLLMTDMPGHSVVTVKAHPDQALLLREQYEEITAGYHTDKRHWVTAAAGPGIDEALVRGLVDDSYRLVVDKLGPQFGLLGAHPVQDRHRVRSARGFGQQHRPGR